jgi:hypothetical protein
MTEHDRNFFAAWAELLRWTQEYAVERQVQFVKLADFTDYIYRMERPYDLPTTIMSASLADGRGQPVLIVTSSPRADVFKEVIVHPADSRNHRHLKLAADGVHLAEGTRIFTRGMLFDLADRLFSVAAVV